MASHSTILKKTEEARLNQLYQTKCDEVSYKTQLIFMFEFTGGLHELHRLYSLRY